MSFQEKTKKSINFKQGLKSLISQIEENPDLVNELDEEQVRQLRKEMLPYSHIVGLTGRHTVLTYTNMETVFNRHMMTLAMSGFVFQMLDEFDQDDHPQMGYTDEEGAMKMPPGWKEYTRAFLKTIFAFDPSDHVRPLKSENLKSVRQVSKEKMKELNISMPPRDTCHRYQRYMDAHFEQYRSLTSELTGFEPVLEDAVQIMGTFDDKQSADDFKAKYQDDFTSQIRIVAEGAWAFTGPWEENVDRAEYLNEHTQFLAQVMDRLEQDEKLGADMMKKRVQKKKKRNIAQDGPDPKSLDKYIKASGKKMEKLGAERVTVDDDDIDDITNNKKKFVNNKAKKNDKIEFVQDVHPDDNDDDDDDSCPDDAVEVNVIEISKGGKETKLSKFYTEADKEEDIQKQADEIQKVRPHPFDTTPAEARKVGNRRVTQTRKKGPKPGDLRRAREKSLAAQNDKDADADADVDDKVSPASSSSSSTTFVKPKTRKKGGAMVLGGK